MEKLDLKKQNKLFYTASAKECTLVEVPAFNFIMLDGAGDPNGPHFARAVETLFPVAYALKFMCKKGAPGIDYGVMPLEGIWWADDMNTFMTGAKESWQWTVMIMQPEFITRDMFQEAVMEVRKKKNPPLIDELRFESYEEGPAAQIMHLGPYSAEAPTIEKLHNFILEQGYTLGGKHKEIYLSDARKCAPEKLKTIIRQPVGGKK